MPAANSRKRSDETIIGALRRHGGNITHAAEQLRVDRSTLNRWVKETPRFREVINEETAALVDDAIDSIKDLIKERNVPATIFTLKARAGWRETINVNINMDSLRALEDVCKRYGLDPSEIIEQIAQRIADNYGDTDTE